ncbi:MAG: D-2-hydroxyacid dehydrogenase [Methylococcales bacterium]|nr:D-2-hydroxyacid dehydrogenase [Methylococcales bacterium]
MKIVFLDLATVDQGDLDLSGLKALNCVFYQSTTPEQVIERCQDAVAVIVNKVKMTSSIMLNLPKLKLICVAATGLNNIDLTNAKQQKITVSNVTNYCTDSVVQHVFSLISALNTCLLDYANDVKQGKWCESDQFCRLDFPIYELSGKTLGIIGYGVLGKAVEKVALAFGMSILRAESLTGQQYADRVPLEFLLQQSDIVTIHTPLTDMTQNMIGDQELSYMKSSALLINTARGGIVDELALAKALRSKKLRGAGFDVLSEEPPPKNHPLLATDLTNLLLTPHIAWASQLARQNVINRVVENLQIR